MVKSFQLLLLLVVLSGTLCSCESLTDDRRIVGLLFDSQWDSLKNYIDKPGDDIIFVLNSSFALKHYELSFLKEGVIFKDKGSIGDTVRYTWNAVSKKISLDSASVIRLLAQEEKIRAELVLHYIAIKNARKAWMWLTQPAPLEIDSLYGNLFWHLGYAMDAAEYNSALPRIKRAWVSGHIASGLALSNWDLLGGMRDEGVAILKRLAKMKSTDAMIRLGDIYDTFSAQFGYDPPTDAKPESSFNWFKEAADLGDPFAMYRLGFIYERSINRKQNIDSAFYWFEKSSKLGESSASSAIGYIYLTGKHVKQNIDSGIFWCKRAIVQNPISGFIDLGQVYERGIGVEPDYELALKYYLRADSVGSPVAKNSIRRLKRRNYMPL